MRRSSTPLAFDTPGRDFAEIARAAADRLAGTGIGEQAACPPAPSGYGERGTNWLGKERG